MAATPSLLVQKPPGYEFALLTGVLDTKFVDCDSFLQSLMKTATGQKREVAVRVTEHPQWEAMSEDVISEVRDQHQRTVFGLRNLKKILAHNGRKIVYVTTDKSYAIKIAPPTAQGQEYYTTCAIIGAQVIAALPANAVNGIFQ
ncbi:TPA: hypothetical protein ACH3X2_012136, partial [Trebouxia sp. C0005]